jgi:hypothetical protein
MEKEENKKEMLMDGFHVPDLLVQLLLECWTGDLSLLASSLSKRESPGLCPVATLQQPLALLSSSAA